MFSKHVLSTTISVLILSILKHFADFVPYTRQGFFCNDLEIRYPFRENTIPARTMEFVFVILAVLLFVGGEYSLIRHLTRKGQRLAIRSGKIHPFINNLLFLIISYLSANLATSVSTIFAKRTICRLRPNFLAVCRPNLTQLCTPDSHLFIEDYECLGRFDSDEYFSFPSGHSSSAANFAVFMIIYLQTRCKFHELFRSFTQFAIFLVAFCISLSRVRDYKHRLSDVLGGVTLGSLFALFFVTHVVRNFRSSRYQLREDEEPDLSRSRFGHLLFPTIVIDAADKRVVSSEYGSLDDRPGSSRSAEAIC